jgi:thymidylate synthase (FAD)
MMLTMNARSLRNFFRLRCCNRAQWEIRELAWQMLALCREKCPVLFAYAGPACVNGPCVEGKMTCGQMLQVRERSEKLNG